MIRPPYPTWERPVGRDWVAEVDPMWRLATEGENLLYTCRKRIDGERCQNAPVAALLRGRTQSRWWLYCPTHMYGRWIEDGQVMWWVARKGGPR
jgi:hypothetical protein